MKLALLDYKGEALTPHTVADLTVMLKAKLSKRLWPMVSKVTVMAEVERALTELETEFKDAWSRRV